MQTTSRSKTVSRIAAAMLCATALACSGQGEATSGTPSDDAPSASKSPAATGQLARLTAYNEAFNRHDVEDMMSMVSPDIEWLSVEGATMVVEAQGAAAMRTSMNEYFSVIENPQSTHSGFIVDGPFVAVRETASWGPGSERKSRSSLAVYEVEDDKIRRVWYYPVR